MPSGGVQVVKFHVVPTELVVEELQEHTDAMWYIHGEFINFLLKLVRCWHVALSENSQLSFSSLSLLLHVPGLPMHYGLIMAPLASLLSTKGSNRVIAAYYRAIREDDLPLISPICLLTAQSMCWAAAGSSIKFHPMYVTDRRELTWNTHVVYLDSNHFTS